MGNGRACARARCVCVRVLASHPPLFRSVRRTARCSMRACACARISSAALSKSSKNGPTSIQLSGPAFQLFGAFLHAVFGFPFMRWELDAHVCVRVRMYADIALLYSAGSFLRLRARSWPSRHYAGLPTWEELDEASKTDNRRTSQSAHELQKVYDR